MSEPSKLLQLIDQAYERMDNDAEIGQTLQDTWGSETLEELSRFATAQVVDRMKNGYLPIGHDDLEKVVVQYVVQWLSAFECGRLVGRAEASEGDLVRSMQ